MAVDVAAVPVVDATAFVEVDLYETTADPTVDRTAAMTAMNNVPVARDRRIDCFPQPVLPSFSGGARGNDSPFERER